MHIRTKLSLLFTALTGAILLLFSLFIYFDAESDREQEFFRSLVKEAVTKANLILDAKVDPETLQTIYMENREILREVEVAIYDVDFNLLYHDAVDIDIVKETEEMINEIVQEGEISFTQNGWQVVGVLFHYEDEPFVITAASFDELGFRKLNRLRNTLFFGWVAAIGIFYFIGVFFSRHALLPFARVNKKINEITATNLDLRLEQGSTKDELAQLTANFNAMLDRLENSFSSQKDFIHAISHEIRTPLAAIIAEIELGLEKEEIGKKSQKMLNRILRDARQLSDLTTDLMDLAKSNYDSSQLSRKEVRLDEILLDARTRVKNIYPAARLNILIDEKLAENQDPVIFGNEYLLGIAFFNLMENACKFSEDADCAMGMILEDNQLVISFKDNGPGIPAEEMDLIFDPFYRGSSSSGASGSGIGLSLVKKIVDLHHGSIEVLSDSESKGTKFLLYFPLGIDHTRVELG